MMRKDVKLGFAIGGVLLAVLVVYILVGTGGGDRKPVAGSGAGIVTEDVGSGSKPDLARKSDSTPIGVGTLGGGPIPGVPGSGSISGNRGSLATGGSASPVDSVAGRDPNKDLWGAALNEGKLMMTETPDAASARQPSPEIPGGGAPSDRANRPATSARDKRSDHRAGANDSSTGTAAAPSHGEPSTAPANVADAPASPGIAATDRVGTDASGGVRANVSTSDPIGPAASDRSAATSAPRTHVIQRNETLVSIAEMAYGNRNLYPAILRANPNIDPKKLRPGMTIVLPPVNEVRPDTAEPASGRSSLTDPASHSGAGKAGADGGTTGVRHTGSIDPQSEYRVSSGDTLERIAMKLYGKREMLDRIYDLNKDSIGPDRNKLRLNMVLKLPEPPTQTR